MQTPDQIDAAVSLLRASLESRTEKRITGALFGELVRKTTPELDIHSMGLPTKATFSRFIEKFFEGVLFRSQRQGADWLYTIGRPSTDPIEEPDYDLWRAFVRPNSKVSVGLVEPSNTLILVDREESRPETKLIPSVNQEELSGIMAAFVDEETSRGNANLPDVHQAYPLWTMDLRERDKVAYRRWTEFRIQRLQLIFSQRLDEAGLEVTRRNHLLELMEQSRNARPAKVTAKPAQYTVVSRVPAQITQGRATADPELRDLVIRAVMSLSTSELRELKLPVGAMVDAFASHYKK